MKKIFTLIFVLFAFTVVKAQTPVDYSGSYVIEGSKLTEWTGSEKEIYMQDDVNLKNVTVIGESVFEDNTTLEIIVFPDNLLTIEKKAFYKCKSLTNPTFPAGLETIGRLAFAECIAITEIILPNSLVNLEPAAFAKCTSVKKLKLSEKINVLGHSAFSNMTSLENLIIPEGVENIGENWFINCEALVDITLPSTIKKIADYGFGHCKNIKTVTMNTLAPPTLGKYTFSHTNSKPTLYIPDGTKAAYEANDYLKERFTIKEQSSASIPSILAKEGINFYSSNGLIYLNSTNSVDIKIYNIIGKEFYNGKIYGEKSFKLPSDIYLIVVNNKAYKIAHK